MEASTQVVIEEAVSVRMPALYAVVMHNDEITTMDFVVDVLMRVFHKPAQEAAHIMMAIHQQGEGIAGVYPFDIAVTKKTQADQLSAEKCFPLKLSVREAPQA